MFVLVMVVDQLAIVVALEEVVVHRAKDVDPSCRIRVIPYLENERPFQRLLTPVHNRLCACT